ncbi:MAG: TetR/AcrR family transcriptional regulator [Clostridiales bacterium]|nr:TetR/AcrR family transcriptional regulator [Clostridiales bacterium]
MQNTTKDRILEEALILFAENGYKGTNLRDLAARLGLSKSALYKHYESKEAIWNALLDKMEAYYAQRFGSMDNLPKTPDSLEEFIQMSMGMIRFTVHDPQIILTRKLLLTEQFHDARVCKLATKHFLEGTANIYAKVFEGMMAKGLLQKQDPAMMAFSFTAPISALIHLCDRETERQPEAFARMEAYLRYFLDLHAVQ